MNNVYPTCIFDFSSPSNQNLCLSRFLSEKNAGKQTSGVYVFSDMNPYVGHPEPMKEGQELFRKGLLSEAALALEAEVMKNPENSEAWRLLGVTHAENDDDQQVSQINLHELLITVNLSKGRDYANHFFKKLFLWM